MISSPSTTTRTSRPCSDRSRRSQKKAKRRRSRQGLSLLVCARSGAGCESIGAYWYRPPAEIGFGRHYRDRERLLGADDALSDRGAGDTLQVAGFVGATTIKSFAADPAGVIELMNGAGGYASSSDAYAAVTNVKGGSELSLGADGCLFFKGLNNSQMSAVNFEIG